MTAVVEPPPHPAQIAVRCDALVHVFRTPGQEVAALRGADLVVRRGETLALLGPSGSGKTTLLWHLAGLLRPTAGTVEVAGQVLNTLSQRQLTRMRSRQIGIMLQNPSSNLLTYATASTNVAFAARGRRRSSLRGASTANGEAIDQDDVEQPPARNRWRVLELLNSVGLADSADRVAGRMSGGEQQRLALAVALANSPSLLLADEPTSQLDHASADTVLTLLREVNERAKTTVVAVTHDEHTAAALGRTVTIRDGRVGAEGRGGEQFVVVGRDGTITLPPEVLHSLPPGSLARPVAHEAGVDLRRVQ